MKITDSTSRMTQQFSAFWNVRNARERTMLSVAFAVVALGLIYALLIDPAVSGRERLAASLPALRLQAAQMQTLAREASAAPAAEAQEKQAPPAPMTKESIEADLARKGLKAQNVALTNDTARVQLATVSFAALIDALDDMQKSAALSVVDANIVALAQPDQVNATVTLRQRKSE